MLAVRDVQLRYKQTALGIFWVVLQPLLAGAIFAVIFGYFAALPSDGMPYLLFVFPGLLAWNFLAGALQRSGNSLVTEAKLITKVYFPRFLIPLAATAAVGVDFVVSFGVMVALLAIFQVWPGWAILLLPLFLLLNALLATGISFLLSALNVKYRDFMYAMPFMIQVWMYASPVVYSASIVPEKWQFLFSLNPMVGIIEGFRYCLVGAGALNASTVAVSAITALGFFFGGIFYFRQVERSFAETL